MEYRLFGANGSPYSIKVRSYFRFKGIPHVWLVRNTPEQLAEHAKHAELPLVPLVVKPDGSGAFQDSTPIIEMFEAERPTPTIHPASASLRFVSELLEEFADEWCNKWMFHYRWGNEVDGRDYARRVACELRSGAPAPADAALESELEQMANMFCDRMFGRLFTIGSTAQTRPIIEDGFLSGICMLEAHFADQRRPYLFGGGQLWNCVIDPTAGRLMRLHAPSVVLWTERMLNPKVEGDFETWAQLGPTLEPFLSRHVRKFLLWSRANAAAVAAKAPEMTVDLGDGEIWTQSVGGPQRYHAKTLKEIRRKYSALRHDAELAALLRRCGCLEVLDDAPAAKL